MKVRTRRILLIAGGLWLILMAYSYPNLREGFREKKSLERTFDHYADALVQKRYDEAYAQCGSEYRHVMDYEPFVVGYRSLEQQYGPLKSYKRDGFYFRGEGTPAIWKAAIVARFFYEKKTVTFDFVLHKEGDRWVFFRIDQE